MIGALKRMARAVRRMDANIKLLGIVSMLNDVASEMIFSILPIFMSTVLMLDKSVIGFIEGFAESAGSLFKIVSGKITGRRKKPVMLLGYSLSTATKPFFAFAGSWQSLLLLRFLDRAGKGIRGPPRDGLIADSTSRKIRGEAFGFHRMMDTAGAAIGPLLAFILLNYFLFGFQDVFLVSVIPAMLSLGIIFFFVKERQGKRSEMEVQRKGKAIGKGNWQKREVKEKKDSRLFILATSVFALGNFSFAFVLIRANELGVQVSFVPLAYLLFNLAYAAFSIPFGEFADVHGSRKALVFAYILFGIAFVGFGFAGEIWQLVILLSLYGVATAGVETVQRTLSSEIASGKKRVKLFGNYQGISGLMAFGASLIAGVLWQSFGAVAAFCFSGITSVLAVLVLGRMRGEYY